MSFDLPPCQLGALLEVARAPVPAGRPRAMIFDVDDTLFRTAPRSLAIVRAWLLTPAGRPYADACAALGLDDVGYGIEDALRRRGVPPPALQAARAFWAQRFFSADYLHEDTPYAGAVAYVRALRAAGVICVYLTGRWAGMREATAAALQAAGFPWDDDTGGTRLVTKPRADADDLAYKTAEMALLLATYEVIGCVDNEPKNVNMFRALVPHAPAVHLSKPCSPDPPPLAAGTYVSADFPAIA